MFTIYTDRCSTEKIRTVIKRHGAAWMQQNPSFLRMSQTLIPPAFSRWNVRCAQGNMLDLKCDLPIESGDSTQLQSKFMSAQNPFNFPYKLWLFEGVGIV